MIRISCTNCKTVLSIDDAFAGGVCRCQHCGTIQTVPSRASRDAANAGTAVQSPGASKSLYQSGARGGSGVPGGSGSGLEELAGIVVSSGLASSRLTRPSGSAGGRSSRQNLMPFIIAAAVIVALLLVIIVILLSRSSPPSSSAPGSTISAQGGATPALATDTPNFCATPLTGNTIIYLLDCGDSSGSYLGELKAAALKSISSLGSDRKFQILFWNNGTDGAYPENTTTYASKENIASAERTIEDVHPFGQSDVKAAMQLAIAQRPDVIILATGKGWDMNEAWLDSVMSIRGSSPVKIHTYNINVGSNGESAPLKKLAIQTGGTYHELSQTELGAFGQ